MSAFGTRHRFEAGMTYTQGTQVFTMWSCECGHRGKTTGYTPAAKRAWRAHAGK
ncbi:hypothetical protein GA0115240_112310 [Streptomyces sp. DvalAA-14]|uniref:hypothetical protein n=1 Tax=unclassified Streptomyces TaxID=2593676 RepID=UPI00081B0331|nr:MULTISPECIES: hypothetical protein [unclassified Streptomyces]MYS19720.1 hypothetical protein [Streptomyces sp. SID4948]SCD51512.1 hypothetical protein GA0115240_112310 [Streptomyces sp. DvalAA-14]